MIARQISFFAPAAVMSAWATVMLHTFATGHINRLLSPMFRSYVLIAAICLLVLSALYVLLYQPTAETAPALAPTGRPPMGNLRQFGRWLVLLVPLVAASILSPSALSSTTAITRGLDSTAGVAAMPSWNDKSKKEAQAALDADPNQPVPIEVTELITLSQQPAQVKSFDGRKVRVVGLFTPQTSGAPKLLRWIMWCCAADAAPASVEMTGQLGGPWKDQQWLDITGAAHFPSTMGQVTPQIEVTGAKRTDEPDEPFLSP